MSNGGFFLRKQSGTKYLSVDTRLFWTLKSTNLNLDATHHIQKLALSFNYWNTHFKTSWSLVHIMSETPFSSSLRKVFVLQRVARESFLLTPSSRSQTLLRHFRACAFALQKRVAFPPYTVYRNSLKEHLWRKTRLFECCLRCYEPKHSVAWRFHPVCQLLFTSWPSICLTRSAGAVHRYRMQP